MTTNSTITPELLDQLLANYEKPEDLIGDDGLFKKLKKALIERALGAELTEHLGYEKGDPAGRGSGNSRNGSSSKTVLTEDGEIEIAIPRDRAGSFEPQLIAKGHVWTAPLRQVLSWRGDDCGRGSHVSGLLVQPLYRLLALMWFARWVLIIRLSSTPVTQEGFPASTTDRLASCHQHLRNPYRLTAYVSRSVVEIACRRCDHPVAKPLSRQPRTAPVRY